MDYTTQVQMVIDIKPLLMKHVSAIYEVEDAFCKSPEYLIRDWNAYEKSNYDPNCRESTSLKGYEIICYDIDKLPQSLTDYRNLTFTIEGKTCALVNFTETQKNEFFRWTGNCILPNSVDLCEFVDRKIFEDDINFESKDDFQVILNDWFGYAYDRQKEVMRKLREVSTPTPQAEVTGFDLGYTDTQLENLHGKLIKGNFLDNNTQLHHFKNAFNGSELVTFEPLKWVKNYYASIFVTHHIEHKTPWKIAERVFNNGKSSSLKNAYKPNPNSLHSSELHLSTNQKKAKERIDKILKSLP